MPLDSDDFRTLLRERSADLDVAPDQVSRVHRGIARRRRRDGGIVAAVVAVTTVGVVVGVPALTQSRHNDAATPTSPSLAPYESPQPFAHGGKLLAGAVLQSPAEGAVTVTFVPTSWDLTAATVCSAAMNAAPVQVLMTVNGQAASTGGCTSGMSGAFANPQELWAGLGVELGKPSTVTFTLVKPPPGGRPLAVPAPAAIGERPTGSMAVGVYQAVPRADYPFPARPAAPIATLDPLDPADGRLVADARTAGANGTRTVPVTEADGAQLQVRLVAPGSVAVWIDATSVSGAITPVQVGRADAWDYSEQNVAISLDPTSLATFGVHVSTGDILTVRVQASGFAEPAWTVTGPGR